jgi:LmbE family N-acetylglucosaminyl deacetylase
MRLERIAMLDLVTSLDRVLREGAFDEFYLPEFNHNRDHQLTHDAALAALRPAGARSPALVAAYESTVSDLQSATLRRGNFYVDISATLERKVAAFREYKTQVREYPHPVSEEGIRRLAAMRGLECGLQLAERFRVLRMLRT